MRRNLTTLAMLILVIAASVAAGATDPRRGKAASGPVVVKRIEVIHGAEGVEIEITGSGPMRVITSRLSDPERFVIDVQDSIQDPGLSAHYIPEGTPEIKSVRIGRVYQPGESITRVIIEVTSQGKMEVTSAADKLKVKLLSVEQVQNAAAKPEKPEKTMGASPAARGGISAQRNSAQEAKFEQDTEVPARAAETKINEGKLTDDTAAAPAGETRNINSENLAHDTTTVAVEPSQSVVQPEPARVEGLISRPPAMSAVRVPVVAPPLTSAVEPSGSAAQPEPARVEGLISRPPAMSAEMAVVTSPPLKPDEDEKVEHDRAAVARSAETDSNVRDPKPIAPPPALGSGVTGKAKDAALGSDEEAAIKATIPPDNRIPVVRKGEAPVPVALLLSGAATAGYYQESTSSAQLSQAASPVGSVRLDGSGYIHSPGFLNFTIKPQGSVGRQPSEGVFPDGEGVFASATLFGSGVTPLTVSYHRLNRKVVTFGPLDRLAGLEANTFQDSFGASWKLRLKHLPELGLTYSDYSDSYEPLAALAPKTANAGRLLSADLTDTVLGWNLQSRYKLERSSQDLINIFDPTQAPYLYKRNDQEIRASADRQFGKWLSTSFVVGKTKSQNEVQGRPFDQGFRFLTGNSFFRLSKKLTLGFHAGVTDNVVGANLERAIAGDGVTPTQTFMLVPTQAKLQMINYAGSAQYAFTNDLRAQADVVHETTQAPENSSIVGSTSELNSVQTGLAFVHRFRWWQFQSYYAVNGGRFSYAAGSSRSFGHRANLGATIGSIQSLELTAGVHGSLQNVTGNTYAYDRSAGANVTLSRSLWEHWKVRATYDRARDTYKFSGTQFSSVGNGISVAVVHPRAEISASHSNRSGLTFQADPRLQFVSSAQSGLLLGAFPGTLVAPTSATWSSAALSFHPVPKFTGRVAWLNSRQQLQGAINNFYNEWEASAGYQFRAISLDVGYLAHDQNFAVDLVKRNRFFFRAVREFTFF